MLGDYIVYGAALIMVFLIPLCLRFTARAAGPRATGEAIPARTLVTLVFGSLTLIGGVLAALFGGTWWLSPVGSIAATAVVGAMLCALAAMLPGAPAARSARVSPARPAEPARRAA